MAAKADDFPVDNVALLMCMGRLIRLRMELNILDEI